LLFRPTSPSDGEYGRLAEVNARSALFDLYGDHLRVRGGRAPIAALVNLLAPLGIAAPAVRTAVSRMVRQGWLDPERLPSGPGYRLTPRAMRRLDEAAARIYRTNTPKWDGSWHLVTLGGIADRATRDRVRAGLTFLGYAPLGDRAWIAAHASSEVPTLLENESVASHTFASRLEGDPSALAAQAWDLEALGRAYHEWQRDAEAIAAGAGDNPGDELAFVVRSQLVHEWRKFLFRDPGLPRALLPAGWPGEQAAKFFDAETERLLPGARRFVDACLRV
jgi:phenylacetic acid degradation operon negative regulatory protein